MPTTISTLRRRARWLAAGLGTLTLIWAPTASARPATANVSATANERATALYLEQIRSDPSRLHIFLAAMPKGGDLHNHLGGDTYAESFLEWAREDHACIDETTLSFTLPPCRAGSVPADSEAAHALAGKVIDAVSMRHFVPSAAESGHDHFFSSFAKFGPAGQNREADMLASARNQAAESGLSYLEVMWFPGNGKAQALVEGVPDEATPEAMMQHIAPALPPLLREISAHIDAVEQQENALMHCGQNDAQPGCGVTTRYMPYGLRTLRPAVVFAQAALGFALAAHDPRLAGINLVAPEDDPVALRDLRRHMAMYHFLEQRYPQVPVSLHAGELAPGLVPVADLRFHIRAAVEQGGARRIGHGVDIAQEDDAAGLLREMAARHVLVEINLTSNDGILGVTGRDHPLPLYLAAHVPVTLSTDDPGVSRSDMTHEYERAEQTYALPYGVLKTMVRNSLEYAFVPGESLWRQSAPYTMKPACLSPASPTCTALLAGSQKARLQMDLERRLTAFEASGWQRGVIPPAP